MKEQLLHFIWQYKLYNTKDLTTINGEKLQIINAGKLNRDGGPDFLNATIKIDDIKLIGNIELHIHASDWKKHLHQQDKKYSNVILHVVYFNEWQHPIIPTLELNGRIPTILLSKYNTLLQQTKNLACQHLFADINTITLNNWKERLVIERLERKSNEILYHLKKNNNDWEQTFYQLLGKYFGCHINQEIFEKLTTLLDYKILLKYKNDITQIEALLFGVAGFLNKDFIEIYPRKLKSEFTFLKQKYQLQLLHEHQWQLLRMRPISFPTIRIAWFAQLIQSFPLLNKIVENPNDFSWLDDIEPSEYWNTHYTFDKLSKFKHKQIGNSFKSVIKTNVISPILFAYGKFYKDEKLIEQALQILQQTSFEANHKTNKYDNNFWNKKTGFDTQALIELNDNYCTKQRCLDCAIGYQILKNTTHTALPIIA